MSFMFSSLPPDPEVDPLRFFGNALQRPDHSTDCLLDKALNKGIQGDVPAVADQDDTRFSSASASALIGHAQSLLYSGGPAPAGFREFYTIGPTPKSKPCAVR